MPPSHSMHATHTYVQVIEYLCLSSRVRSKVVLWYLMQLINGGHAKAVLISVGIAFSL